MKKFLSLAVAVLTLSGSVFAQSTVTQTVNTVEDHLPVTNEEFKNQINHAVYELTTTDIPAIISTVNTLAQNSGTVSHPLQSLVLSNLTANGTVTLTAASLTAGTGTNAMYAWTNTPTFQGLHQTTAPLWFKLWVGTNAYAFPAFQVL